jgi:hypothetical protein
MLKYGLCVVVLGAAVTRPARPGSRWCRGAMAFRVWVRHDAPACRAARP